MTTIAELQVKVDSTEAEKGIKALNDFATAAEKATKARKDLTSASNGSTGTASTTGSENETRKVKSLSEAIDAQTRKLASLNAQRKMLNDSPLKTTDPSEYQRLNREIDARTELVKRQGNSLDRLAQQAKRESDARVAAAEKIEKEEQRSARTLEAKSVAESKFAAAQARNLDSTIAGLSRQIKVQQEYNKTMETLNLNRFQGNLSGAEYDTYVKRAAAKRDESLAVADNTKEIARNQRMLDSVTSSLGKAERAEVSYSRSVSILNEGLRLGSINQSQYNKTLDALKIKRDLAVAAADGSAASEARLAGQLQTVLGLYNPVTKATDGYNSSVKILDAGLKSGKITIDQYNTALDEQKRQLDAVKGAQSGSTEYQAKQYQAVVDKLLPLNAQMRELERQERILNKAKADGKITTDQQIKDYERATKAIAAERVEINRKSSDLTRSGNSAKQDAAALRGLPAQFTDVVVSLQGGQAPLTVLLQQGGQVKDMFGGVLPAIKAVAGALLAMITPVTVLAAGMGLLAYGFVSAQGEVDNFNKAMVATKGFSGLTTEGFRDMQKQLSSVKGTMSEASDALIAMVAAGNIPKEQFEGIGIAALKMKSIMGQSIQDTVDEFSKLNKDPLTAVLNLDEKYRGLTGSIYLQIAALERQGDTLGAAAIAVRAMQEASTNLADETLPKLGYLETAWKAVAGGIKESIDALRDWGRVDLNASPEEARLKVLNKELKDMDDAFGFLANKSRRKAVTDEIGEIEKKIEAQKRAKQLDADTEAAAEKARLAQTKLATSSEAVVYAGMTPVQKAKNAIQTLETQFKQAKEAAEGAKKALDPSVIAEYNKALDVQKEKLKDAEEAAAKKGKPKGSPIDSTSVQDVKSNLSVILSEYDGYYKKVTALGAANVVSAEATFASQKAILQAEAKAVGESYDNQISAIKKLQGNKKNNAAQNISLANQLTRAEDARTKFMQDNAAKQEKLDIEAKASIDEKTRNIKAYTDALNAQIDAERKAGERAVKAVSGSDRENSLNDKLSANDDKFVDDQKKLADQLAEGSITADEYATKLDALTDAHSRMSNQIIANANNIDAANQDWQNGAIRGFKQYVDEGQNAAKLMENFVKGSLDSMTDSLATFVTTGKADFRSLATSIISDLAKIAIKMAASQALSSMFGGGGGWAGSLISSGIGYFTGGGASTSSSLGSSQAGYSSQYIKQAKGGGWNGGTQFFANGGAFTNSIVSSATSFGMAGGGQGIMGEAGPEAIMPLTRTTDGSLGVRMVGGGVSSGGVQVYVNVASDGTTETSASNSGYEQFGRDLGDFVDQRYQKLLARDLRDGGAIKTAIK